MSDASPDDWQHEDTKVLQILANVLANHNREDKALILLEYLWRREPENPEVLRALSGAYLLTQRYQDALVSAEKALGWGMSETDQQRLRLVRSHALWGLERFAEAQNAMQDYLSRKIDQ